MNKHKNITSVEELSNGWIYTLPRGGYIIKTSQGLLQIGSPPETIKDTILYCNDVPGIYCIGESFFSFDKGINVAELEFPIYYNFFIKKRKTIIVGSKKTCEIFEKIINIILFGETPIQIEKDYHIQSRLPVPDIKKEISFFLNYSFEDIVEFVPFDTNRKCSLGDLQIEHVPGNFIILDKEENDQYRFKIPDFFSYKSFYKNHRYPAPEEVFIPPAFGMTCLGASHGFDPKDNTSGFIFWMNGSGIMIDPPVNSTDILHEVGINPQSIDTLILTHIHADHDSGFFQKILEQNRVTVYTTQTVMDMWLRKYALLSSLPIAEIKKLFDFVPVIIDKPILIKDVEFVFRYMIHSIPTIGFTMKVRGTTITFSSDHLNEPVFFKKLLDHKYIGKKRYDELMNFPWESDIIYHEAGIPPLHTPVAFLDSLPKEIRKKISLYHISQNNVPQDTLLSRCQSGVKNTITYTIENNEKDKEKQLEDILFKLPLFKQYKVTDKQVKKIREMGSTIQLSADEILPKNPNHDCLYVVLSGALELVALKRPSENNRLISDYQVIHGYDREENNLKAIVSTEILKLSYPDLLKEIQDPDFEKRLNRAGVMDPLAWEVLEAGMFFDVLNWSQRVDLINSMVPLQIRKEKSPYQISSQSGLFFYYSGTITDRGKKVLIQKGDLWANSPSPVKLLGQTPEELEEGLLYHVQHSDWDFFCKDNPGFVYRFNLSNK